MSAADLSATCPDVGVLNALLDRELDPSNASTMERHIASCRNCAAAFARLETVRQVFRARDIAYVAPEHLRARIAAAIEAEPGRERRATAPVLSGAASAVVEDELQPATRRDDASKKTDTTLRRMIMSSGGPDARDAFFSTLARDEMNSDPGLQAGDGGVEHVACERVIVLAAGEPMPNADDRRAD